MRKRFNVYPNFWLVLVLCFVIPALAQQDTGVIAGTALDPGASVIPQVAVKVINTGTNFSVELTTDQNGDFVSPPLRIGTYRLEAEKTGFKKLIQDGIELRVQDRLQVDLHMEVGGITETVEVTAAAPLLQTATSSV